jgi:hypothetical protein
VALFPVGTIDVCYANIFMFKCIFEVVDNNRSEGIPKSACHRSGDFSEGKYVRESGFTGAG